MPITQRSKELMAAIEAEKRSGRDHSRKGSFDENVRRLARTREYEAVSPPQENENSDARPLTGSYDAATGGRQQAAARYESVRDWRRNTVTRYERFAQGAEKLKAQAREKRKAADRVLRSDTDSYRRLAAEASALESQSRQFQARANQLSRSGEEEKRLRIEERLTAAAKQDQHFLERVQRGAQQEETQYVRPRSTYANMPAADRTEQLERERRYGAMRDNGYYAIQPYLKAMSRGERMVYDYYLGIDSLGKTRDYFSALEPELEKRISAQAQRESGEFAREHPVVGTMIEALTHVSAEPVMGLMAQADNILRSKMKNSPAANGPVYAVSDMKAGTGQGLAEHLTEKYGMKERTAQFWSGIAISLANSTAERTLGAVTGAAFGSAGAAAEGGSAVQRLIAGMNKNVPLAILGTTAATEQTRQSLQEGKPLEQAVMFGAACGIVEAVTEKIGMEAFVTGASGGAAVEKTILGSFAKELRDSGGRALSHELVYQAVLSAAGLANTALSEGMEEVLSNVASCILDLAVNRDGSEYARYYRTFLVQGMEKGEAHRQAFMQCFISDSAEAFRAGAAAGAIGGSLGSAIHLGSEIISQNALGQAVIDGGAGMDLVDAGLAYSSDTEVYQIAAELRNRMNTGIHDVTAAELTRLAKAMEAQSRRDAASGQLTEASVEASENLSRATGEYVGKFPSGQLERMDGVLRKIVQGKSVTDGELRLLGAASSPAVREVLSRQLGAELRTGNLSELRTAVERYQATAMIRAKNRDAEARAKNILYSAKPAARVLSSNDQSKTGTQTAESDYISEIQDRMDAIKAELSEDTEHGGDARQEVNETEAWRDGFTSIEESAIIRSGARITDLNSPRAEAHAKRYYGLIRSMKTSTDVQKIARNTGISETEIARIKEFLFLTKHDLGDRYTYFDPDFAIAHSWQRLISGNYEPHDLTLLKHEIMESRLMAQGMNQDTAHTITSGKYNYKKECQEYYASLKEHQDHGQDGGG